MKALMDVFPANEMAKAQQLADIMQAPSETCEKFVQRITVVYDNTNCQYPTQATDIEALLAKFQPAHAEKLDTLLRFKKQEGAKMTLFLLKVLAQEADRSLGRLAAKAVTVPSGGRGGPTPGRHSYLLRSHAPAAQSAAVQALGGRGRGRPGPFGRGGRGQGRGALPGLPPDMMPYEDRFSGDGSYHAGAVIINMDAEGSHTPFGQSVKEAMRANAANTAGRRRPHRAEAMVPPAVTPSPPPAAPLPAQLSDRIGRASGITMPTGVARLATSPVTMSLQSLVALQGSSEWETAAAALQELFNNHGLRLNAVSTQDDDILKRDVVVSRLPDGNLKIWDFAGTYAGESVVPKESEIQPAPRPTPSAPPVNSLSTTLGSPFPMDISYAAAAAKSKVPAVDVLTQESVCMPFMAGHLQPGQCHERKFHVDTGSEINSISEDALTRDLPVLMQGRNTRLRELEDPVSITLFDGQRSSTKKILCDAQFIIGDVIVRADFFVVPNGCAEYLLGGGLLATLNMQLMLPQHKAIFQTMTTVRSDHFPQNGRPINNTGRQTVPLYLRRLVRKFTLKPLGAAS